MKKFLIKRLRKITKKIIGFGAEDLVHLTDQIQIIEKQINGLEHFRQRFRTRVYLATTEFLPDPSSGKHSYGYEINVGESTTYKAFEDVFRGNSDLVKQRLKPYEPFYKADEKIVEIGSGRGEFLDLLLEKGANYIGVDSDYSMVEHCKHRGHTSVLLEDYESFLMRQEESSFHGIFSFQFIEHIPSDRIGQFFKDCWRVLMPDGILVVETVNPYSVEAFRAFHVDLTHQKLLYPEVLLFFCKAAGFRKASIFYPNCGGFSEDGYDETGQYAVIAYK